MEGWVFGRYFLNLNFIILMFSKDVIIRDYYRFDKFIIRFEF